MLGTPPNDKLHKHLHISNAREDSWIMMIMIGSKMYKTEYDLKAIMYPAYDAPHKLCNIKGNTNIQQPRLPSNNAGRPMRQFKCPSLGSSGEPGHPQFDFCFLVMGEANVRGAQTLTQGSRLVLTEWGNTPIRHTSTEKYTSENIYARCQSSMVVMLHIYIYSIFLHALKSSCDFPSASEGPLWIC